MPRCHLVVVARATEFLSAAPVLCYDVNQYGDGHAAKRIAEILARVP
jgi:hypothetical protein